MRSLQGDRAYKNRHAFLHVCFFGVFCSGSVLQHPHAEGRQIRQTFVEILAVNHIGRHGCYFLFFGEKCDAEQHVFAFDKIFVFQYLLFAEIRRELDLFSRYDFETEEGEAVNQYNRAEPQKDNEFSD